MNRISIPHFNGKPVLDGTPRQAFRIDPEAIIDSIKQQFSHRSLVFRELGQNSVDSGSSSIEVEFNYQEDKKNGQGFMVAFFRDNGSGMDFEIIKKHYLCLFDSSKEDILETIGEYSLGRLSMLCYDLASLQVITMPPRGAAYAVDIRSDLSGRVYEIFRKDGVRLIGNDHGTLVYMKIPMADKKAFVAEVKTINSTIQKELCWIKPSLHQTTAELQENGELKYNRERVNTQFGVPGEFSLQDKQGNSQVVVQLASGLGRGTLSVGLTSPETKSLSPIIVCKGKIPVERPSGLPWTGTEPFTIRETHIILDSFSFTTNIGRNRIRLDHPFAQELLPKIFKHLILDGFVRSVAILLKKSPLETYQFRKTMQTMLADVMIQSEKYGFSVPVEVYQAPFIPSYVTRKPYTISFLDEWQKDIYFTWERPASMGMSNLLTEEEPEVVCICLADLPYDFRNYLEDRYQGRIKRKEDRILVNGSETSEFLRLAHRVEVKLRLEKNWSQYRKFIENFQKLPNCLNLRIGTFCSYSGTTENITPTFYRKEPSSTIWLNHNNAHIKNLLELLLEDQGAQYQKLAAHFLMREIFCDEGLGLPANQREKLLTKDLIQRFNRLEIPWEVKDSMEDSGLGDVLKFIDEVVNL